MLPVDFVKALGVAILITALDLLCAYGFVSAWVMINHHPLGMAEPKTIALTTLSTQIFGPILFALFVWFFSRNRPDRNAYGFALAVVGLYLLVDWGMVAFQHILEPTALITAGLKLAGAMIGAWLARFAHSE